MRGVLERHGAIYRFGAPLDVRWTIKDTMRGKRIRAALCEETLETLLKLNVPE